MNTTTSIGAYNPMCSYALKVYPKNYLIVSYKLAKKLGLTKSVEWILFGNCTAEDGKLLIFISKGNPYNPDESFIAHRQADNTYIVQEDRMTRYDALCDELRVHYGFDTSQSTVLTVKVSEPFGIVDHEYDCFKIKRWVSK